MTKPNKVAKMGWQTQVVSLFLLLTYLLRLRNQLPHYLIGNCGKNA